MPCTVLIQAYDYTHPNRMMLGPMKNKPKVLQKERNSLYSYLKLWFSITRKNEILYQMQKEILEGIARMIMWRGLLICLFSCYA